MKIPRLVIAGVSSGSGKTTVAIGLIGTLKNKGYRVKPFKIGPDYIDTGYLSSVSGEDALNLDLWLMGRKNIIPSFINNAADSDIAIIEGVMGLFDGGDCSTAEVSKYLRAPVLLCINSEKIGESASAIVKGFTEFDPDVNIIGIILTKVSGLRHYDLLKESIENSTQIPVCGYLIKDNNIPLIIIDHKQTINFNKDCKLEIIYPFNDLAGKEVDNLNNTSIIAKLIYKNTSFLFTGDAEIEQEQELLNSGIDLSADVLKVCHHGANTSSGKDFLQAINPKIAIIQVGKDNKFNHPSRRVIKRMERMGVKIFRNDLDGTVRLFSDGNEIFEKLNKFE